MVKRIIIILLCWWLCIILALRCSMWIMLFRDATQNSVLHNNMVLHEIKLCTHLQGSKPKSNFIHYSKMPNIPILNGLFIFNKICQSSRVCFGSEEWNQTHNFNTYVSVVNISMFIILLYCYCNIKALYKFINGKVKLWMLIKSWIYMRDILNLT